MKKIYLLVMFFASAISSNYYAQCTVPVPYAENFDTTAVGSSTNNNAPTCWKYIEPSSWPGYGYVSTNNSSAPNGYYIYSTNTTGGGMLVSPTTTNLMNGNNRVRFMANAGGANYVMEVGTLSDSNDPATFTIIGTPIALTTTFTEYTIDIPVGTNLNLAFRHPGQTGSGTSIRIDDIFVEAIPTCVKPSNVTINSITTTTAGVNWTAPTTVPANGYEIYYTTTNTAPTAATVLDATNSVTSATTSATISGLNPSSTYYVFVRAVCNATDKSIWTNTTNFVTACVSFTVPYTENFDTTATGSSTNNIAPTCWAYLETSGSAGYGYVRNFNPNSTPNSFYMYNGSDVSGNIMLVSPPTTNLGSGNNRVRFMARGAAGYTLEVGNLTDPSDPSTFSAIPTTGIVTLTAAHAEYIVDLPTGTYSNVVFRHGLGATARAIYIDDINVEAIPSCIKPSNVTVNAITSNTASVNWTASTSVPGNGYQVYFSTTNAAPTASTVLDATNSVTSSTTSATISGLTPTTTYYVFVRAICSGTDQSLWTNTINFITVCTSFAVPYTENFDTTATGTSTNNIAPTCWSYLETSGSAGYGYVSNSANSNSLPNSFYMYNSTDLTGNNMLVSPPTTNLTSGTNRVRFFAKGTVAGYPLQIGTLSNHLDPTTFTIIGAPIILTTTQTEYIVDIPVGANSYLAFRHGMDTTNDAIYIDDINVEAIPSCVKPSNVTVNSITTTTAAVNWTAPTPVPGNGYQVYFSTTDVAPTASTVLDATNSVTSPSTSATITGLTPATIYYVFVRAICSATDQSVWTNSTSATTFVTACTSFAVPYTENFDATSVGSTTNNNAPTCWSYLETSQSVGYGYVRNFNPNSTPNSYYLYNAGDLNGNIMLVSPPTTDLGDGNKRVRFMARAGAAGYTLEVGILTDPSDPSTFFAIPGTGTITLTAAYAEYIVDLPAAPYSNVVFRHGLGGTLRAIYLDDITVENIPSCVKPSDVTVNSIATSTATVNWVAPNPVPANGYEVYYSTTNAAPTASTVLDATNSVTSATTSAAISGLTPATTYYVFVRALCSTTSKSIWTNSVNFITACVSFTVPYTEKFDTTSTGTSTNNNAPTCWSYLETSGSAGYGYVSNSTNSNSLPNSFYMYNGLDITGHNMLVSPPTTNLTSGTNRVRFFAKGTVAGYPLQIGTLSNPTDPTTFTIIGSPIILTTTQTEYIVDIPVGTNSYLAFRHGMNTTNDAIYIDDINVEKIPTCIEPTAVAISNVTTTTATVNWTASTTVPGGGYEVYYSTTNAPPTASTVLDATNSVTSPSTSAAITGLTPATTYYVFVRSVCSSTDKSIWTPIAVTLSTLCQPPAITGTTSSTSVTPMCKNDMATLTATADAGATINWYATATGGTVVGTGASFTTPPLVASTNYYASASVGGTQSGALPNATSTSGYTLEAGLFFDATSTFTLQGVNVYPIGTGVGNVVISLQDGNVSPAVTLQTITVSLTGTTAPYVKTYVPLNFTITPETNYKLMMMSRSGGVTSLVRESGTSWGTYPLTVPSLMSITNGNCCSGNTTSTSYYYFYDWQLSTKCESARTAVAVDVDPTCSVLDTNEVNSEKNISIYPNPFTDFIRISDVKNVISISIVDLSGRLVKTMKPASEINLGDLKTGMYLINLKLKDGSVKTVKAIKK